MKNIGRARNATPHDSASQGRFNMVLVTTTAGDITLTGDSGAQFTLSAVPVGTWIPVGSCTLLQNTGTTATGFLVM